MAIFYNGKEVGATIQNDSKFKSLLDRSIKKITADDLKDMAEIPIWVFAYCEELEELTIPDNITYIGGEAFYSCNKLLNVKYLGTLEQWMKVRINASPYQYSMTFTINGKPMDEVVIPDTVTEIKERTFAYGRNIKSIQIPQSVKSIGQYAFYRCVNLRELIIPEGVPAINVHAFDSCYKLRNIQLPDSITSISSTYPFNSCYGLTSLKLPNMVSTVGGSYYFSDCQRLVEIISKNPSQQKPNTDTIVISDESESKIDRVGDFLFYNYNDENYLIDYVGQDKDVVLPENYKGSSYKIRKYALSYCDFENITLKGDITELTTDFLYGDENIKYIYLDISDLQPLSSRALLNPKDATDSIDLVIGNNTNIIPDYFCFGSTKFKSLELGSNVESIGAFAFNNSNIEKIVWNNKLTHIGARAFETNALTELILPDSLITINLHAFWNSPLLETLQTPANMNINLSGLDVGVIRAPNLKTLIYATENQQDIITSINGGIFNCGLNTGANIIIKSNVKRLPNYIFSSNNLHNYSKYTSVTIEEGLQEIGEYAFYYQQITSLVTPNSLRTIGGTAFANCSQLETLILNNGLLNIGHSAFQSCSSLAKVVIPSSVTLEESAFAGCTGLTEVEINCKDLSHRNTFGGCSNLKKIVIGDTAETITDYREGYRSEHFANVTKVEELILGKNLKEITAGRIFQNMQNLKEITVRAIIPPTIDSSVFPSVSFTPTIYIPTGTLDAYSNATNWKSYASKFVEKDMD